MENTDWIERAREAIRASSKESTILVGCDSDRFKKNKKWYIKFATVIIIHKDSCRGAVIHHHVETIQDYSNSIKQKLMMEVQYAVTAGLAIVEDVGERRFQIHLDLNGDKKHKSNEVVKEACGYVRGTFGFDAHIKPQALAASYCADHLCRGKSIVSLN